jgi:hypothetical protein
MRGKRRKSVSDSQVKCPSLPTSLDQTVTSCRVLEQSAMSDVSATPLNGRQKETKNVSDSRVKCPSSQNDCEKTYTDYSAWERSAMSDVSVTPLQYEGRKRRKTVTSSRVKCFVTDQFRTNSQCL